MLWSIKKSPVCASQPGESLPPRRWGRKVTLAVLLLLITIWCIQKIANPETFPIRDVQIIDTQAHVDHQLLRQRISPFLLKGMLWLDTNELKNALQNIPWVNSVSITRSWPSKLLIVLHEQTPVAHWNNTLLLNNHLTTFDPGNATINENLPWLNGPQNQQNFIWQSYQQMNELLQPLHLQISTATLTPRGAWTLSLNNGIILILGRDDTASRLERFISVYPKVFAGNEAMVEYVDLRYSNGFAIKWKNNPIKTPA